jgi:hypothetical protein
MRYCRYGVAGGCYIRQHYTAAPKEAFQQPFVERVTAKIGGNTKCTAKVMVCTAFEGGGTA